MNGLTTITTKGQVTIPENVRKILDISPGDKAVFSTIDKNKKQLVVKIIPKSTVNQLYGSLASSISKTDMDTIRQRAGKLLGKKYMIK
ncbi:AbrB family transcriptional regulator [Candidatus Gottesmanbacteria bacterium]|nr:AbrB family transcriptional regulator [Candidatus Gottesmanbacteria bacterium]